MRTSIVNWLIHGVCAVHIAGCSDHAAECELLEGSLEQCTPQCNQNFPSGTVSKLPASVLAHSSWPATCSTAGIQVPTSVCTYPLQEATAKIDEYARGMISGSGSTLFEELGLYYIGPIDGHNMDDLVAVLEGEG